MIRTLAISLALIAMTPSVAIACQCGTIPTVPRAFRESATVVTGIVVRERPSVVSREEMRSARDQSEIPALYPVTRFDIAVTRIFKGSDDKSFTLTHFGCCMCEQHLDVGKEYLLFVIQHRDIRGGYMVSFCDPNRQISEAAGAIAQIGRPSIVFEHVSRARGARQWVSESTDYIANVAVRAYLVRATSNPFIEDPFGPMLESLLFKVVLLSLGVFLLVALVVIARRRFSA